MANFGTTSLIWTVLVIAAAVALAVASFLMHKHAAKRREAKRRQAAAIAAVKAATAKRRADRKAAELAASQKLASQQEEVARLRAEQLKRQQVHAERQADIEARRMEQERTEALEKAASLTAQRQRFQEAKDEATRKAKAAAAVSRSQAPAAAMPTPVKAPSETLVLVADDSKLVRVKIARLLEQHEYQVIFAVSGLQAAQLVKEKSPDVLITDFDMQGLNGLQLIRYLRTNPKTANLPIFMITASCDQYREGVMNAGANGILGKPYDDADLIKMIRVATGH